MQNKITLKRLVNNLVKEWLPEAVKRRSFIVSEISENAFIIADEKMVAQVMENLLKNVIRSSRQGCIRISAEQDGRCTLLRVKDNQSDYSGYISGKMTKVEPLVRKIGGTIYYEFNRKNSLTVVLCFYHQLSAA
jgi:light-regulated signal transduction histidine kinase (bacteriophytochrome)